jgi:hypothetical protein
MHFIVKMLVLSTTTHFPTTLNISVLLHEFKKARTTLPQTGVLPPRFWVQRSCNEVVIARLPGISHLQPFGSEALGQKESVDSLKKFHSWAILTVMPGYSSDRSAYQCGSGTFHRHRYKKCGVSWDLVPVSGASSQVCASSENSVWLSGLSCFWRGQCGWWYDITGWWRVSELCCHVVAWGCCPKAFLSSCTEASARLVTEGVEHSVQDDLAIWTRSTCSWWCTGIYGHQETFEFKGLWSVEPCSPARHRFFVFDDCFEVIRVVSGS